MITLKIGQRVRYPNAISIPGLSVDQGAFEGTITGLNHDENDDFWVRVSFDDGDTVELSPSVLEDLKEDNR